MKILVNIVILCAILAHTLAYQEAVNLNIPDATTNGTESFFLSPHGLGRVPEVAMALDKIYGQVKVARTTHNVSSLTYIIDNVTVGILYNPSKQNVTIPKADYVQVTGGRFEFTYSFNYTKIQNRNNITGHAYGSVLSDSLTYYKEFSFCGGFLCFRIPPNQGIKPIDITQNMTLKRMEPFNETDLTNLQGMLDKVTTQIEPSTIKQQILTPFNQLFPLALNDSLNHELFGESINYTWHSNTHGEMHMQINHQVHGFGIDPENGYRLIFVTLIEGYNEPICDDETVPLTPASFEIYGGTQSYQLNCLYESVVKYMHSNGWLDVTLDSNWEVNAFQFYAGDLFDLINNLYQDFSPRAIIEGKCQAQKQGLEFYAARQFQTNTYALLTTYKCTIKGTNSQGSTAQIMKFTVNTRLYIAAAATTKTLTFKIVKASLDDISFDTVGKYIVRNLELATYRASQILKSVENTMTFGTNFPSPTKEFPKTRVDRDWVFFYDNSHFGEHSLFELEQ